MNSETQPWGDVATEDYADIWDIPNLQLYWASLPQEDFIENQTWNGTALKIYLYSYYGNQFQLWLLTTTTNFNIIINGNYTNYGANHQVLQIVGNAKIGTNIIIIVPNPTNRSSVNTGVNSTTTSTTSTSPINSIISSSGIKLTQQEAQLFGFIVYFTVVGLTYLFSRNKTITTLGSLAGVVIVWALGLWPLYMLFLVGAVSLFMIFYTIRGEENGY